MPTPMTMVMTMAMAMAMAMTMTIGLWRTPRPKEEFMTDLNELSRDGLLKFFRELDLCRGMIVY